MTSAEPPDGRSTLIRLAVRAPAEAAEPVLAALLELVPAGLVRVDGDGWVEYALYGRPGELPSLPDGGTRLGGVGVSVRAEAVPDDWADRWKRFHRPVLVAGRVYVRPPWEDPAGRPDVLDVVIDPARAFGTGTHPTTQGCLELLLELEGSGGSLADLGCGSGLLAIAAAKLGFTPVTAVDCDLGAVEETRRNAQANGVAIDRVERADLRHSPPPAADVVVANLMRPLLLRIARLMRERPRALIFSGTLDEEADEVVAAFAPLRVRRQVSREGWASVLLTP